jgi:hypothetical protein
MLALDGQPPFPEDAEVRVRIEFLSSTTKEPTTGEDPPFAALPFFGMHADLAGDDTANPRNGWRSTR